MTVPVKVAVKNSIHQVAESASQNYGNGKAHKKIALSYPIKIDQQSYRSDNGKNRNDSFKIRTEVYSKCYTRIFNWCDVKKFVDNGYAPAFRQTGMFKIKEGKIKSFYINLGNLVGKKYQERKKYYSQIKSLFTSLIIKYLLVSTSSLLDRQTVLRVRNRLKPCLRNQRAGFT